MSRPATIQLHTNTVFFILSSLVRSLYSKPVLKVLEDDDDGFPETDPKSGAFYWKLGLSVTLVLLGGVFAGLTIALMGQDTTNLRVLEHTGDEIEKKYARKVLTLLNRGKHWVLVTLLLSNVITNETLPIITDSLLGGGWPAIAISTVSVVVFGEIIPQAACVRYGLLFGASFAPFVLVLMYIMYPIAYPTALLLDYLLGKDEGQAYRKAGLKALVAMHKSLGVENLNDDEVTIISAVLDLKEKAVGKVMTPIKDVYTLSADRILDEQTVDQILSAGYSRIPIHVPRQSHNFIGMLLVKMLITYDPDDKKPVSSFALATLPETQPETSCLDILNFFQEGKSHMILVSTCPGDDHGAVGVLTLEDVIEELIGEEIIDETDVYIDVHKHLRRITPGLGRRRAPLSRKNTLKQEGDAKQPLLPKSIQPSNLASKPIPTANSKIKIKGTGPTEHHNQDVHNRNYGSTDNTAETQYSKSPDGAHLYAHARSGTIVEHTQNGKVVVATQSQEDLLRNRESAVEDE